MNRNWWLPLLFAFTVALALGFAACGGDDDDDSGGNDTTATATVNIGDVDDSGDDGGEPTATEDNGDVGDDDDGGSGNHPVGDACELISASELEDVIGEGFDDGESISDPVKPECDFETSDPLSAVAVYLQIYWTGDEDDAAGEYDLLDSGSDPVDGYGDKAHWLDGFGTLEVLTGEYDVILQVVDLRSESDDLGEAKAIMDIVLPRLP